MTDSVIIYTDGASRGNPGPAAAGFVINDPQNNRIQTKAFYLGQTTNNVAEYTALIKALQAAKELGAESIKVFSDSELIVKQIKGQYRVKSKGILPLYKTIIELLDEFKSLSITHIKREKNKEADRLVNKAIDLQQDIDIKDKSIKLNTANKNKIKLGVLLSGGGRTLLNINEQIQNGSLNAEVPIVISSRSTVAGVERAKNIGMKVEIVRTKDYPDINKFSAKLFEILAQADVDLVVQAGWLCLWKIPAQYENKVMNIHPALLPSFGGKGMWGHHVHEAVLAAGCKVSGCTVHFCTNEYDKGPIIVQRTCPVAENDTPDTLATRVFEQECIAYPHAIRLFADNKLKVMNDTVKIKE